MSQPRKKASGAQFRKWRAEKAKTAAKQHGALEKFLLQSQRKELSSSSDDDDHHSETETDTTVQEATEEASTAREDRRDVEEASSVSVDATASSDGEIPGTSYTSSREIASTSSSGIIATTEIAATPSSEEEGIITCEIDYNNPSTWDLTNRSFRCHLVKHGPCQYLSTFVPSQSEVEGGRKFSLDWFEKRLSNGEKVPRLWLIYCSAKNAVFCFPCILFPDSDGKASCPAICDPDKGYSDWKHLSRAITQHENAPGHKRKYLQWKTLERDLEMGTVLDQSLQAAIASEKERWRHYLKVILRAVLFCAGNNLALRGTSGTEAIGEPNSGVFLSAIEFASDFDTELKKRLQKHKKGEVHYLSPAIQNEVIILMAKRVRATIMEKVKNSKYYSILFDSTPDVSHKDQVAQIVRYVNITEGKVSVEESFIDLIESHEKTGAGLAGEFMQKLEQDGLAIEDIRGQGYDNGANMAGKYSGVQAHFLQRNEFAIFVPCAAHSLNRVGVHAASCCPEAISFFGNIQTLYNYFASSTTRWAALMSYVKLSLKCHADTRWCSKAAAVSALCNQLKGVIGALKHLHGDSNQETVSGAINFVEHIIDYKFVCLLTFWDTVLNHVDRINKALQSKETSVHQAAALLSGLKDTLQELRSTDLSAILKKARDIAISAEIQCDFPEKRTSKRKRHFDEECDDEMPEDPSRVFRILIYKMIDKFIVELSKRYSSISDLINVFGFLFQIKELDTTELCKCAADLALKYHKDLDAAEIVCEIQSLKMHLTESFLKKHRLRADDIAKPERLLQFLYTFKLVESYPNIVISLRIFLTLPVTVASCERTFSKLKLIKNYLRSTMSQERLSGLAMLSVEHSLARTLNFDDVIDEFAAVKSRKVPLL